MKFRNITTIVWLFIITLFSTQLLAYDSSPYAMKQASSAWKSSQSGGNIDGVLIIFITIILVGGGIAGCIWLIGALDKFFSWLDKRK